MLMQTVSTLKLLESSFVCDRNTESRGPVMMKAAVGMQRTGQMQAILPSRAVSFERNGKDKNAKS